MSCDMIITINYYGIINSFPFLYTTSPRLIYFITGSLHLLSPFTFFIHSLTLLRCGGWLSYHPSSIQ